MKYANHLRGPEHLRTLSDLTRDVQRHQRAGLVTSYEIGQITADGMKVMVFMPEEMYTREHRLPLRRTLKEIGYRHGIYLDPQILPEGCDGASV